MATETESFACVPTLDFDSVYGSGSAPMIVAHDVALQRLPTRVQHEWVGPEKPQRERFVVVRRKDGDALGVLDRHKDSVSPCYDHATAMGIMQFCGRGAGGLFGWVKSGGDWEPLPAEPVEPAKPAESRWRVPDAEGWHWLEELPEDSGPKQVRRVFYGGRSQYEWWNGGGWVRVHGRVCPIGERPENKE